MKKLITVILCFTIAYAIIACGNDGSSAAQTPPEEEMMDDEKMNPPYDVEIPDFSEERNEELVELMMPEGAEVIMDIEGSLILHSQQSLEELILFYQAALDQLGAVQEAVTSGEVSTWGFAGAFDDGKIIFVDLRDEGDFVTILVGY